MYIASASSVVKIHEFPSNKLVHTYETSCRIDGSCRSLSWAKDGNWLAVVPFSGCTEIVSLKGQCKLLHTVHSISEPSCASFQNLTKRTIAIGTKHGQVLLYDIKSKGIKARFPRVPTAITHVGFTAKDTHCYAGCANGDVLLFNNVAKNVSSTLNVPKSQSLTALKAHIQRKNLLIGGSSEGIVCVWDVNFNKIKFQVEAHSAPVSAAIFSPVNAALVVSAGLDRVVRVFDIETKSRISTIPVENNVLSVDFLENSLYIVMGAQNGKIHIYDTRNLQDSVCSYEAHNSSIKHLAYQNFLADSTSNSSLCSVDAEERSTRKSVSNEEIKPNKARTSDFFGMVADEPSSVQSETCDLSKPAGVSLESGGDSFMKALGLDTNNTMESLEDKSNNATPVDDSQIAQRKPRRSISNFTPNPPRVLQNAIRNIRSMSHPASTPKIMVSGECCQDYSPIMSTSTNKTTGNLQAACIADIHNATQTMQAEMKKALEEMEKKMSYKLMDHAHLIRRMILDLHMRTLKEFIKVENNFNLVLDEITTEPPTNTENLMAEEIYILNARIQELERQLATSTLNNAAAKPEEENGNEEDT